MSTFLYNSALQSFATGTLDWATAPVTVALVNASYSPLQTDTSMAAVPTGAIVATATMANLSVVNGICKGSIPVFAALESASEVTGLLFYLDNGDVPSGNQLIYYSSDGVGFPFTPAGFNYGVGYQQTYGGWFQV